MKKYLYDIKESISSIDDYLGEEKNFEKFRTNKLLKRAVERELEIIGEATNRILNIDDQIKISEARRIVNLRNMVIHAYDSVDDIIIWGILSKDLPRLKKEVDSLLQM
ncbi:DUF86 domain-containing protein [Flavobacterium sp. CS20]|uniref:HepT-like ribonuclease domain-containing protein n=1 Tax=Flavobacterium sp. CS20 TaxID=2775246 RepID=UPI001FFC661E|nr:HepT-like ribonuclease domain-containing protein [Flavobacterium sp. CS20]